MAFFQKTTDTATDHPMIDLRDVHKYYKTAVGDFHALNSVDLQINAGEFVSIIGKSGSGKTTLLNMITGIDIPSNGEVWVNDTAVHKLSENQMARWRGKNLGIVFQFFQLLPMISVIENIMLPMDFCRTYPMRERYERAMQLLELVELADHAYKLPTALSGGQQQRVAIARALANDPPIVIADEPTGNLDSKTAESVFTLFNDLVAKGKTIIIVTHDSGLAKRTHRTALIADGEIVNEYVAKAMPTLTPAQLLQLTRTAKTQHFEAGTMILSEGTNADTFYHGRKRNGGSCPAARESIGCGGGSTRTWEMLRRNRILPREETSGIHPRLGKRTRLRCSPSGMTNSTNCWTSLRLRAKRCIRWQIGTRRRICPGGENRNELALEKSLG